MAMLAEAQTATSTAAQSAAQTVAVASNSPPASTAVPLDTDKGKLSIDIEDYFTPKPGINFDNPATCPPLLLPSPANIDALSNHASARFQQLLADNQIPSAPATITYDNAGHMQLPADYAYADQLRQALSKSPTLERELSTINALTSHYSAMQDSIAFSEEYSAAKSQAAADAVVAKYSYLFSGHRHEAQIALAFSPDGTIHPTADGQPYHSAINNRNVVAE